MTTLGRALLLLIAVLLIAVPILLLLVNYGLVIERPIEFVNEELLQPWSGIEGGDFTSGVRLIAGLAGVAVALLAGLVLVAMLKRSSVSADDAVVQDDPGALVALRPRVVERLAESAALAAGAGSPHAYLASHEGSHNVIIDFQARTSRNLPRQAAAVQGRVRDALAAQGLQPGRVEVMLVDTVPRSRVE